MVGKRIFYGQKTSLVNQHNAKIRVQALTDALFDKGLNYSNSSYVSTVEEARTCHNGVIVLGKLTEAGYKPFSEDAVIVSLNLIDGSDKDKLTIVDNLMKSHNMKRYI